MRILEGCPICEKAKKTGKLIPHGCIPAKPLTRKDLGTKRPMPKPKAPHS